LGTAPAASCALFCLRVVAGPPHQPKSHSWRRNADQTHVARRVRDRIHRPVADADPRRRDCRGLACARAVGIFFGFYPAPRASRLEPIEVTPAGL